jgi:hypothetical protein
MIKLFQGLIILSLKPMDAYRTFMTTVRPYVGPALLKNLVNDVSNYKPHILP